MNKKRQRMEVGGEDGFEEWGGYMAAKKNKLQGQFMEQAKRQDIKEGDIFKNVSVFVNGYTVPSADDIKRVMMVQGGIYHHYFSTEHTTHIIASNLPDVKVKQLKSLHVNVVKPEWITACLEANCQVDFRPYLLYSHQSRAQPSIRSFAEAVQPFDDTSCVDDGGQFVEDPTGESNDMVMDCHEEEQRESSEDLFTSLESQETLNDQLNVNRVCKSATAAESSRATIPAKCASEPNFLSEFYRNSRLHHISTMGAMFKQLVSDMRQKKNDFPGLVLLKKWKQKNSNAKHLFCNDEDGFGGSLDGDFLMTAHEEKTLSYTTEKIIMHIDMDCFFVSVGIRKYPHLKDKPVAVTHSKGNSTVVRNCSNRKYEFNYYKERLEAKMKTKSTSENGATVESRVSWTDGIEDTDSMAEIASCSYAARSKGVKNGMFVGAALKLCPDLEVIPYDFEEYDKVARTLYNTVASYTVDIEAVSCDEMLVDCTDILKNTKCSPVEFASFLRKEIKEKTQCPASTGFGSNRLLARLATRKAKPDGVFCLEPSMVLDFMTTVDVKDLPGVGRAMACQLHAMGAFNCGDLQKISKTELCKELGSKSGELLYGLCRGQDTRPLNFDHQRKSVSAEVNYGIRFKNQQESDTFIRQLAVEVHTRLTGANVKGSCITLKLLVRAKDAPAETAKYMGHGVCDAITRSSKLPRAVCDADTIASEVLQIMKKLNLNACDFRGIGIQISQLESLNNSTGALDKFIVKNSNFNVSNQISKSSSEVAKTLTTKKNPILSKTSPRKKVFSSKGTLSIDQFMAVRKKTSRVDNVAKLPAPTDLDLEVLEALPEDIRIEVLEAYSSNNESEVEQTKCAQKPVQPISPIPRIDMEVSYSQVDPTFLKALPSDMREELEADFRQRKALKQHKSKGIEKFTSQTGPSTSNIQALYCLGKRSILRGLISKPNEIKCMIRQWILEETEPQPCDVHILEHYFCDLVHEKSIDDLHVLFKFFRRCVLGHASTVWRKKFHDILTSVQASMQQVYKSTLLVEDVDVLDS